MNKADPILISTAYFPPASYIRACLLAPEIIIESKEYFVKQSFRNRCHIYGANGLLALIIPVSHQDLKTKPISEVNTLSEEPWKKIHWRSITSAYRRSPFFEYYEDDFKAIYTSPELNLFNSNLACLELTFRLLKRPMNIKITDQYEKNTDRKDYRTFFHPKNNSSEVLPRYYQAFEQKHGFIPDLSVIDLLCNLGPQSAEYLMG